MPHVSIIIPCYNEEKTIELLLSSIYHQTWPVTDLEVIISDGMSTDQTRSRIVAFQAAHDDLQIRMVDNSRRSIPAALNRALELASGDFIIRLDAHSEPENHYIERCVADLSSRQGDVVGGIWKIRPGNSSWQARSIAAAAAHPLGVGDALYRYATQPAVVDTVPFGAYHRSLLDRIGRYDETLLTNEDYEFNTRVRKSGGKIWLDPLVQSIYYARPDLNSLGRQYWRYGYWKYRMLRRYPSTLRWRQALPPLFVLSLVALLVLSPFLIPARLLLSIESLGYLLILIGASIQPAIRTRDFRMVIGIPLAIATMQISWGAGFLGSVVKSLFGQVAGLVR